jgi:SmpA / OmlA family
MRKRLLQLAAVVALAFGVILCVGLALSLPGWWRHSRTAAAFARVEEGMSREQVEAIMGPPMEEMKAGYTSAAEVYQLGEDWSDGVDSYLVYFSDDGRVTLKLIMPRQSLLDDICQRARDVLRRLGW